jgi:hypothetical protein
MTKRSEVRGFQNPYLGVSEAARMKGRVSAAAALLIRTIFEMT